MFLSVIIPVYNAEPYLRGCIDSVIAQDMGDDLELLLVDDGSTDASGSICDEYANLHSWVRVFHISNGGVGNARNIGLKNVRGDYFTFIDSDDFLESGIYQEIFRRHCKSKADIYVYGYKDYPAGKGGVHLLDNAHCDKSETLAQLYLEMKRNYLMFPVFNKIFNSVDNLSSRFSTEIHYFEDCLFTLECLGRAKSVEVIKQAAYNYVNHPGEHLGRKYTSPDVIVEVARELKKRGDILPQSEGLKLYTVLEYYNNLLHAVDSCCSVRQKLKYIRILLDEIKIYGFKDDFRQYLGRRKMLMVFPNPTGMLVMCFLRSLIIKIR